MPSKSSTLPLPPHWDSKNAFAGDYRFAYGRADRLREGTDCVVVTCGTLAGRAVEAADRLRERGQRVGVLSLNMLRPFPADAIRSALRDGIANRRK